jgi:hypothetical protein
MPTSCGTLSASSCTNTSGVTNGVRGLLQGAGRHAAQRRQGVRMIGGERGDAAVRARADELVLAGARLAPAERHAVRRQAGHYGVAEGAVAVDAVLRPPAVGGPTVGEHTPRRGPVSRSGAATFSVRRTRGASETVPRREPAGMRSDGLARRDRSPCVSIDRPASQMLRRLPVHHRYGNSPIGGTRLLLVTLRPGPPARGRMRINQ